MFLQKQERIIERLRRVFLSYIWSYNPREHKWTGSSPTGRLLTARAYAAIVDAEQDWFSSYISVQNCHGDEMYRFSLGSWFG